MCECVYVCVCVCVCVRERERERETVCAFMLNLIEIKGNIYKGMLHIHIL